MAMSSIVGSNTIMLNQREVKYVKLINYISSFTVSITLSPDFLPFKLHIQWLMSAMSICLFTSRVTRPETDIMENTIPLKYKSGKLHPNLACFRCCTRCLYAHIEKLKPPQEPGWSKQVDQGRKVD